MFAIKSIVSNDFNIKGLIKKITGFSIIGLIISILGLLATYIFIGLLKTPLYITYILIYFFSILFSYLLNIKHVFKVKSTLKRSTIYFSIYLSSMLIGLFALKIFKKVLLFDDWIISYLTIPITMTWNFVLSYWLLNKY